MKRKEITVRRDSPVTGNYSYVFSYTYNLAGGLLCEQYPSGRLALTSYDLANRVAQLSSGKGTCATPTAETPTYAGGTSAGSPNIQYAPSGAPWLYVLGNGVWHSQSYNLRLQECAFQDVLTGGSWGGASCTNGPISGGTPLLAASMNWGSGSNNGNLQGASYVNSGAGLAAPLTFSQTYTYDSVNRLKSVVDTGYTRNFQYDAFGNMWISGASGITPAGNAPQAQGLYGNNQLMGGSYDASGNQTAVNGNAISYDAESRQTGVNGSGVAETYLYDGDGKRVEKMGGGITTVYVYDAAGELAAEYSTAASSSPCKTCYLIADHLGTPRLITDGQGNVIGRHDYLPFGEEIGWNGQFAGRTSQWGPGNDSVSQKFTGKERDAESGLDYFGARYYGSALGRFTSPDWSAKPEAVPYAKLDNPQTLNLYAYVLNNPLVHRDADGHIIDDAALEKNKSYQKWKRSYLSHEGAQKQWDALNNNKDLTVHVSWDSKSSSSVTSGYQWDKSGTLTSVNVSLAGKTGDTGNAMSAESGYIHGSTLNSDTAMRQAYVIAHEFAHVEYAETQAGGASLRQDEQTGQHLQDLYKQFGPKLYPQQPGVGDMQRELVQHGYEREKGADQRAWDVLGDPK